MRKPENVKHKESQSFESCNSGLQDSTEESNCSSLREVRIFGKTEAEIRQLTRELFTIHMEDILDDLIEANQETIMQLRDRRQSIVKKKKREERKENKRFNRL